ncbi:helix-turn-helix transcriptional regulator [Arthrobacter caoxuetaonis]|uniref:Helix-turn-helix domain-containing protein n=1 Tax=Arthrobacter caoxuetaonis TaxID=2886935 RepID=A0A9X1SE59_9MICC|nr:helix-turn-helix transcriptional regulator [Arthrobacter caoxuetaonis]MCC3299291.1 helix-turn-helix domain-containing protein [Arthrobacter caoxuetaonis]USQ59215.1 helix-turn-helix domain-containing protein [Arthrobacter caoxuetaonis]
MPDFEAIGQAIRDARRRAGITQKDAADLSGVAERTVRAIESGVGNPSLGSVIAVANTVGLHVKAL